MDDEAAQLAEAIGRRVRLERQARDWTLDQLSEAAGVSRRMIVNVEQGSANPSVGILLRIGDALGVGLPALVEPPHPRALQVTRAGDGAVLWTGAAGGRGVLVAGTQPPDVVELWDWTLGPGDAHESEGHVAGTSELLQVLDGVVVVSVGAEETRLAAGDAITFDGSAVHAYANPGTAHARFSLAVFEPGVGLSSHAEVGSV